MSRSNRHRSQRAFAASVALSTALVSTGILLRLRGVDRSLWQDEAWVANSILADTLRGMFFYDAWLQTSPPLFLLMVRGAVSAQGLAEWTLRLIPFLAGAAACVAMAVLVYRLPSMSNPVRVLLVGLFGFSSTAIHYSYSLKQYSSELMTATALLLVTLLYVERPSRRRFWLLAVAVLVSPLLGYGTVFLLPGVLAVGGQATVSQAKRMDTVACPPRRFYGLCAGVGLVLLLEYVLLVAPNSGAELHEYWLHPVPGGLFGYANRFYSDFFVLLLHVPIPRSLLSYTGARVLAVTSALILLPALYLRIRRGGRALTRFELLVVVSAISVLLMVVANVLRIYPLVMRTSLIMLPCVVLLIGYGITLVQNQLIGAISGQPKFVAQAALWLTIALLVGCGLEIRWNPVGDEDLRGAVEYLKEEVQESEQVYIHATCLEGYKLYARMLGWEHDRVIRGGFGWPCCPRQEGLTDYTDQTAVQIDSERILAARPSGTLWVMHTGKPGVRESLSLMGKMLASAGCREREAPTFHSMEVRAFDCGSELSR